MQHPGALTCEYSPKSASPENSADLQAFNDAHPASADGSSVGRRKGGLCEGHAKHSGPEGVTGRGGGRANNPGEACLFHRRLGGASLMTALRASWHRQCSKVPGTCPAGHALGPARRRRTHLERHRLSRTAPPFGVSNSAPLPPLPRLSRWPRLPSAPTLCSRKAAARRCRADTTSCAAAAATTAAAATA